MRVANVGIDVHWNICFSPFWSELSQRLRDGIFKFTLDVFIITLLHCEHHSDAEYFEIDWKLWKIHWKEWVHIAHSFEYTFFIVLVSNSTNRNASFGSTWIVYGIRSENWTDDKGSVFLFKLLIGCGSLGIRSYHWLYQLLRVRYERRVLCIALISGVSVANAFNRNEVNEMW